MISKTRFFALIAVSVALALGIASCTHSRLSKHTVEIVRADGSTVQLVCEIARTAQEQQKGYMGRKTIPDGTGMIFAFAVDQKMSFWMKNTPHPLSIAYIDSSGTIREIYDMAPFSLSITESERSLRYALEVPQGWFARAGISSGDRISAESLSAIASGQ